MPGLATAQPANLRLKYDSLLEQARAALTRGDYNQVITYTRQAREVAISPDLPGGILYRDHSNDARSKRVEVVAAIHIEGLAELSKGKISIANALFESAFEIRSAHLRLDDGLLSFDPPLTPGTSASTLWTYIYQAHRSSNLNELEEVHAILTAMPASVQAILIDLVALGYLSVATRSVIQMDDIPEAFALPASHSIYPDRLNSVDRTLPLRQYLKVASITADQLGHELGHAFLERAAGELDVSLKHDRNLLIYIRTRQLHLADDWLATVCPNSQQACSLAQQLGTDIQTSLLKRLSDWSDISGWAHAHAITTLSRANRYRLPDVTRNEAERALSTALEALSSFSASDALYPRARLLADFHAVYRYRSWRSAVPLLQGHIASDSLPRRIVAGLFLPEHERDARLFSVDPSMMGARLLALINRGELARIASFEMETMTVVVEALARDPVYYLDMSRVFATYAAPDVRALAALTTLLLFSGDVVRARDYMLLMTSRLADAQDPVERAAILARLSSLSLSAGDIASARALLEREAPHLLEQLPAFVEEVGDIYAAYVRLLTIDGHYVDAASHLSRYYQFQPGLFMQGVRIRQLAGLDVPYDPGVRSLLASLDSFDNPQFRDKPFHVRHMGRYEMALGLGEWMLANGYQTDASELVIHHRNIYASYYPAHTIRIAALDTVAARMLSMHGRVSESRQRAVMALSGLGARTASQPESHPRDPVWWQNPTNYILHHATDILIKSEGRGSDEMKHTFRALQVARQDRGHVETMMMIARVSSDVHARPVIHEYESARRTEADLLRQTEGAILSGDNEEFQGLQNSLTSIRHDIQQLSEKLAVEEPAYLRVLRQDIVDLADVQSRLRPDEMLLYTQFSGDHLYITHIRRNSASVTLHDFDENHMEALVRSWRETIENRCTNGRAACTDSNASELYRVLLADADLSDIRHLIIVPDGPLVAAPFSALWNGDAYLIEHFAYSISPSPSAFTAGRSAIRSRTQAEKPLLAIGAPSYSRVTVRAEDIVVGPRLVSRSAAPSQISIADLAPLPETAIEVRALARALNADADALLIGDNATEQRVRDSGIERYNVIAFATHGLLAGEMDGYDEPGLALTPPASITKPRDDGYLSSSEIASMRMNAAWVLLSACNTARDDESTAAGLSQLARAFIYAGARSLLVTHWPIETISTVDIITSSMEHHAADEISPAESLRRGIVNYLKRNPQHYGNPNFWAPFFVVHPG